MAYNIKRLLCQLEERRWCSCGLLLWYVGKPVSRIFASKGWARFARRIGETQCGPGVLGTGGNNDWNRSKVYDTVESWTRW